MPLPRMGDSLLMNCGDGVFVEGNTAQGNTHNHIKTMTTEALSFTRNPESIRPFVTGKRTKNGRAIFCGTLGDDEMAGTTKDNFIHGGQGDDIIKAGSGNDIVIGGKGDDDLYGGEDADTVSGGEGNDTLIGGSGNDIVIGGKGDDVLYGGEDADTIAGGEGNDTLIGGSGADKFIVTKGMNVIEDFNKNEGDTLGFGHFLSDVRYEQVGDDVLIHANKGITVILNNNLNDFI